MPKDIDDWGELVVGGVALLGAVMFVVWLVYAIARSI